MELVAVEPDEIMHSLLEQHGDVLIHYASPYYDPVKAKEYYERTKQLKGRKPAATKTQREAIGYANNQIASAKKAESAKLAAAREQKLKESRDRIKKKLEETIAKRADAILKQLANLPEDASPEVVARIMKTQSKNAQKARRQASQEVMKAFKDVRTSFAAKRKALDTKYAQAKATEEAGIRANVR